MRKSLSHQAGLENFTLTELGIDFTPPRGLYGQSG